MSPLLHVLVLTDTVADADMLARELNHTGFELAFRRATTEAAYLAELESPLDLILADNALSEFDAMRALQVLRSSELDIPLIVVAETADEQAALECVSLGAADFVFKERLARLRSVVVRALDQRELRAHARAADAALRESEERFRMTFEQAAVGIAHLALSGKFLRVNKRLCEIVGYSHTELLDRTVHTLNNTALVAHAQAGAVQLLAGQIPSYSTELSFVRKNGLQIWITVTVSLVRSEIGVPLYFIALIEDVTERRNAEATRVLLAAIVDASDDAIIGVAPDGTVISWNSGAERLYGYRADQMIGQSTAVLRPPHLEQEVSQLNERLEQGERTARLETVRRRSDGQLVDVALTISAISDASGSISGYSAISRDISERKRAERALRQKTAFIQLFQEVAVAANQATSFEQALQTVLDTICTHIGWPIGHVYLPDPEIAGALMPTDIWHLEDRQRFAAFRQSTALVRLAPGIGLPGQAMTSRNPAWISEMVLDASTPRTRIIRDIGIRSGFALPVLLGDEIAAVLEFFATEAIEPDEALLDVLHHVGTQLGRVVERARADAALRETEERFRVLFEHSPDAIVLIDPHSKGELWPVVECNGVACQMNGYTRAELIGQSIDLLNTRPGDRVQRAEYIERLRREGTLQFEDVHRRKDGSLFPIEVVSSLIWIGGRELVLGIDRDISERKRAEDSLRAAETQYRTLVEQIPAIIYTAAIDAQSSTSYVSPQIEAILGFTPEEWLASPGLWLDLVYPDDRASVLQAVNHTQNSDVSIPLEYRAFTRDGRVVWLRDAAKVVRDDAGQPLFLQGITLDITDRKRAEEALRAAEAQYRTLVEQIPAMIYTAELDERSSTTYISPQIKSILGFTPEEWVADPAFWLEQVHPDDRAQVMVSVHSYHGGEDPRPIEYRSYTRDGRIVWLLDAARIVRNEAGQPLFLQGVMQDVTARKRAEDALRDAEAQYRTLVEQLPAIIYTAAIDAQSSTRYVSPQIEAILGFTPEEWMATPDLWLEQVHPDDRAHILEAVGHAHASDAPMPIEYRSFTRDGRLVWLRDAARVVRDQDGKALFMQGITFDITERKLAEAALVEREAYFRALIEHSSDAVALFDIDGSILYGSPATQRILGYALEDFLGNNAFGLIHPDDQALVAEKLNYIAAHPNAHISVQARVRHADGSWRDLEGRFTNLLDYPAVRAIVNNYHDVTESKRAEMALRESERLYRTLASNFPNGAVVLFDHDLRFTIADGARLEDMGLTRERAEGHTLWDVYSPEECAVLEPIYRAALAGMPHVREAVLGEHTYVIHTLPVRDESGQIVAGMKMTQDITDRKRVEEALIDERALLARRVDERTADLSAANAELARTAVLKDEFLASMSHELRTPLNAVLGLSEALQEEVYGALNDRQRRSLHSIEESGRHLLDLINDILDLAKIGAGKLELVLEAASIEPICQASLRLIKQLAHKKNLSVDLTIDPAVTLLNVDARRLKQILVNLLSNAVKFTPDGGSIGLEVTGDAVRQAVDLTVWDTGIGIAHEQMTRLFQPFVQLDSRLARQYEGTGLGLALVYRMVEMHGGSIGVTSELGRGSRFTVALPWPSASAGSQASVLALPKVPALDRATIRRVLIVEDSPTTADQITRYLHELGIESDTVPNGAEVVALASAEQPDMILLDLLLPDISGWDVLALLKAERRTRAIPVVIISVIDERSHGLALGAAEYLVKPVARADFQRILPILVPNEAALQQALRLPNSLTRATPQPVVLLAEDNEANILMISDYLGTHGYQVVIARNGAEAIARAREARPAIVLMDIQMPGMDGLEATRRIRTIDDLVDLPIIALTALAMPGDRERCLAAGANDYLSKPVSLHGLAALIENNLHQHSGQQRNHL